MSIVPFRDATRRAPEAGRLRLGVKSGRAMKALTTMRFTSQHEQLIEKLAEMYGGTPKPWHDDKARIPNQFEVITEVKSIPVYLPPDGLSQNYEMWTGGGCVRRCNGDICVVPRKDRDGIVLDEVNCICVAKGQAECRPHTRLTFVIPELPFMGTWRLETKGKNAMAELPGMFDMVRMMENTGRMVQAALSVEARKEVRMGQTHNFVVPVLSLMQSPLEIQQGQAGVAAISAGGQTELAPTSHDVEVLTPELVAAPEEFTATEDEEQLMLDAEQFAMEPIRFLLAIRKAGLDPVKTHADMIGGKVEPLGFKRDGTINWRTL